MAADDLRRARSEDRRQFIGGSDVRRKPIRSFKLASVTAPRPAAVFVDEVDAGGLESAPYHGNRGSSRGVTIRLKLPDRYDTNGERPRTALHCSGVMAQHQNAGTD
jgi:hypothetical protein